LFAISHLLRIRMFPTSLHYNQICFVSGEILDLAQAGMDHTIMQWLRLKTRMVFTPTVEIYNVFSILYII
jgi:hypothetical protein